MGSWIGVTRWGDRWMLTSLDADSKLIVFWRLGSHHAATANDLMADVAARLSRRVQLTTEGHKPHAGGRRGRVW